MQIFYLVPTRAHVGLTSVSLGLVRALQRQGYRVGFARPVAQEDVATENSVHFARQLLGIAVTDAIPISIAAELIASGNEAQLLDDIVAICLDRPDAPDILVVEGMHSGTVHGFTTQLNADVCRSLKAEVVLVANGSEAHAASEISGAAKLFSILGCPMVGGIVNKAPRTLVREQLMAHIAPTPLLGIIAFDEQLLWPRTLDVARHLNARVLVHGDADRRRVRETVTAARSVPEVAPRLVAGALIVSAGDRDDVMLATALAVRNGIQLAGLVLTHGTVVDPRIHALTERAFTSGLPILGVDTDSFYTATHIGEMTRAVPADDLPRMNEVIDAVSESLEADALRALLHPASTALSPPAFRHQLMQRARAADKRIVLPEGDEPRTIRAAVICTRKRIARCLLLGDRKRIEAIAVAHGIALPPELAIEDPEAIRERYVAPLAAMRASKGLTAEGARSNLTDNVMLGTMMLALDDVDGLVSGAVHTTAHTIRPALQLIKTAPGSTIVSSVFFMLMPDEVLVYGDCAVNPNPDAGQLAEIALQSAASARAFGVEPRVAMISYSTGSSGAGDDVEKVRQATRIAHEREPGLMIDGPLQYDAASVLEVGRQKAPGSSVAGRATVFVFPDLNTGNTTYKAVQRSANVVSVGPMLQGLNKPVNDLSRGALVDDIVFTIALTAIQAQARS